MRSLEGLQPERVFYYFNEITKIPRCSYDEKRISDYLAQTGRNLGLVVIQDEALNVIIKKPASKGYENRPVVVLQGHMDMVCEKSDDSDFDFSKDPIDISVEGDFIMAKETTLGADNGIAVAMCLAILESKDIKHPPLEVLITSNEESGMTGAGKLDPSNINGRILINIDSEEEGTILVSCAGGERDIISIPLETEEFSKGKKVYSLKVSGLLGGHSGMEIDKGRGNSNKIMGRVLDNLDRAVDFDIISIEGGSKSNAIPRLSKTIIAIEDKDMELAKSVISEVQKGLRFELASSDKNVEVALEPIDYKTDKVLSADTKNKIISALVLIPNGVQSMSMDIEGLVESSNNLGVVKTLEDMITIECAIRSSIGSLKGRISHEIRRLAELMNCKWERFSSYPAWEYNKDSYVREVFKKAYRELYNDDLKVAAIHAGLECGLFKEKFGDIDMVSFGPNLYGVHAPGEKLSISSTKNTWDLLLKVLETI